MTVLPDVEILTLVRRGLVTPFDHELVNPASLDVRLGNNLLVEIPTSYNMVPYSIAECSKDKPYMLQPHEFVLAETSSICPTALQGSWHLSRAAPGKGLSTCWRGMSILATEVG